MSYKIALIEDDELIRNMVKLNLEKKNYQVSAFPNGELMLKFSDKESFDLFILDILLPGVSGIDLLKELRKSDIHSHVPVLMLTVQSQVDYKINAFNIGADDYLVKPFVMDELIARVNALIRRSHGQRSLPADQIFFIDHFQIDFSNRKCQSNRGDVLLSEKEIKLLKYFLSQPGQTLKRADILEEVWGMDVSPTPRTIDNFVLKFRKLFEGNPEKPKHFISVRNVGYRFQL